MEGAYSRDLCLRACVCACVRVCVHVCEYVRVCVCACVGMCLYSIPIEGSIVFQWMVRRKEWVAGQWSLCGCWGNTLLRGEGSAGVFRLTAQEKKGRVQKRPGHEVVTVWGCVGVFWEGGVRWVGGFVLMQLFSFPKYVMFPYHWFKRSH